MLMRFDYDCRDPHDRDSQSDCDWQTNDRDSQSECDWQTDNNVDIV